MARFLYVRGVRGSLVGRPQQGNEPVAMRRLNEEEMAAARKAKGGPLDRVECYEPREQLLDATSSDDLAHWRKTIRNGDLEQLCEKPIVAQDAAAAMALIARQAPARTATGPERAHRMIDASTDVRTRDGDTKK